MCRRLGALNISILLSSESRHPNIGFGSTSLVKCPVEVIINSGGLPGIRMGLHSTSGTSLVPTASTTGTITGVITSRLTGLGSWVGSLWKWVLVCSC